MSNTSLVIDGVTVNKTLDGWSCKEMVKGHVYECDYPHFTKKSAVRQFNRELKFRGVK